MEEREASVASSTDFYGSDKKPDSPAGDAQNDALPAKRKADDLQSQPDKKRKLESPQAPVQADLSPCAGLAPAAWQHIFLFCPLSTLGRLLRVNRSFHSYLTSVRNVANSKPDSGFLRLLKSESIWASARNMHPTKPPKPLPGFSEMQMWQLVRSNKCQFCEKEGAFTPGEKIWQKGPGATGVRILWPFGIRSCGSCLPEKCQTDSSLLFSTASALRPALPFAFVTNDQNYIPAYTLQTATTPANVEIVKYYYKPHVEEITKELEQALGLGSAAAEEWSKGLDSRGKERMKVAENWERWEVRYQWWKDHQEPKQAASATPSPAPTLPLPKRSPQRQVSPAILAPTPASKYRAIHSVARERIAVRSVVAARPVPTLTPTAIAPQFAQPRPPTIPPQAYTPQPVPGSQPRGERNLHDANEAKAIRKLDIERRCQQHDPPIPPNLLRHMDSFKAAIQISQPLNDYTWGILWPRLVAQLPAAQQAESDHVSRVASLTTRAADRRQQDASLKEVKEVLDREWEESQRPVRDRLNAIADDFINQDWDHGRAVTYDNSPKFAVDLLMYVRRKFYEEITDDGASQIQQHADATEGAESRRPKLVLENMKWVYDNKLKPLTEQFRKELFLCYGNGCEGNTRFYGFEGVIQHFGAKHTNTFSVGNVVVAWREAEWPEETPFHPDPISVKHAYQQASNGPNPGHSGYGSYYGGFSRAGTSTPHMQPHLPQTSPGPYSYGGQYNGPFAPPHAPSHSSSGYDYSQAYGVTADSHSSYPSLGLPGYGNQASGYGYMTSPAMSNAAIAPLPAVQTQPQGAKELPSKNATGEEEYRTDLYDKQVSTIIEMTQDLWRQTSGIKDFPNSLRVYVLLHRVISKFQMEFNHEPNLNHFIDALSNHEIPRALKNAPGLSCKACQDAVSHPSIAFSSRPEERRVYTVLNLFSHFQSQHSGPQAPGYTDGRLPAPLDWKEDMIELPSDRFISGLIHAPGMDDDKLHMIATVFPRLFPTPLPRIGLIEHNGVASPAPSVSKDSKDLTRTGGTPGVSTEKSEPSSLASPYTDSPRPPKPSEDEYDPQRPALPAQATQSTRTSSRKRAYQESPPLADRRPRYYAEPRYYLPRDPLDDDYPRRGEFVDLAPSPRIIRDSGPSYEDYPGRRPLYREHEAFYAPDHGDFIYAHPREGLHSHEYEMYPQVRYVQDDGRRSEYRLMREPRSREHSLPRGQAEADRFLEEFVPGQPAGEKPSEPGPGPEPAVKPSAADAEPDDGSRYTPPPPSMPPTDDQLDHGRSLNAHRTAPSTVSNGSRYDDHRSGGRNVPTPDSGGGLRRAGPHRRRDRHHDYVPSRYYRYMSVARDEPYPRGSSMNRSQSKRYERYEDARRRIDQQETPQPGTERDHDPVYSRDQSVDQGYPDESYQNPIRAAPREYVPLQDRHLPYSPPRYRFSGPPEDTRGPPPVYVDEYGQPLHEYEIIRVPRDHRAARTPYAPARYYPEYESDHFQYIPVSHERPPPRGYHGRPSEYIYYEERERPQSVRRPALDPESEASYEPPPEIKVEAAPAPALEGP